MKLVVLLCILPLAASSTALAQTPVAKKKTPSPAVQSDLQPPLFADARNMTLMIFFAGPAPQQGMLPIAHAWERRSMSGTQTSSLLIQTPTLPFSKRTSPQSTQNLSPS